MSKLVFAKKLAKLVCQDLINWFSKLTKLVLQKLDKLL